MTDIREELARAIWNSVGNEITFDDYLRLAQTGDQYVLGQVEFCRQQADAIIPIVARAVAAEREACAKVADKYADNPVGDERQETLEAFNVGMTYRTGGCDNGSALAAAIRARGLK